jgi:DNA-binding beta-propeller fold protein YncE
MPPPTGYLNGPCGLAVDSTGRFFVSDYYHHAVDVFSSAPTYVNQLAGEDPLDGPCGLALDATNHLYVNNFHRNVVKFDPSPSFGTGTVLTGAGVDSTHPTGVAVDPSTGNVYVNERTYITGYDSSGAQLMDGASPLKIGLGALGDAYGLAISRFPGTYFGDLYVPDASTNTVKVYDPSAGDKVNPAATIKDPFNKPFVSLRDSAIAVDQVSGDVYFADNTQPQYTEKPQATIYIYSASNVYKGHLKYNIADTLPPGLAVDNSIGATQGRVYVTSGNTDQAGIYAYPPGAGVFSAPLPPTVSLAMGTGGSGEGAITASSPTTIDCSSACETEIRSGAVVTLSADPTPGSTFAGWSGAGCSGTGECTVRMDEAKSVSAKFGALPLSLEDSAATQLTAEPVSAGRQRARHHWVRHRHKRHRRLHRHHRLTGQRAAR